MTEKKDKIKAIIDACKVLDYLQKNPYATISDIAKIIHDTSSRNKRATRIVKSLEVAGVVISETFGGKTKQLLVNPNFFIPEYMNTREGIILRWLFEYEPEVVIQKTRRYFNTLNDPEDIDRVSMAKRIVNAAINSGGITLMFVYFVLRLMRVNNNTGVKVIFELFSRRGVDIWDYRAQHYASGKTKLLSGKEIVDMIPENKLLRVTNAIYKQWVSDGKFKA